VRTAARRAGNTNFVTPKGSAGKVLCHHPTSAAARGGRRPFRQPVLLFQ